MAKVNLVLAGVAARIRHLGGPSKITKRSRPSSSIRVLQFYSKSKDADDLGIGLKDWRKRLSNFHSCKIEIDGRCYPSVEHAFHASKARCSDRPEIARTFECGGSVGSNPAAAKTAGGKGGFKKQHATLDQAQWDRVRDAETTKALRARARADAEFCSILRATAAHNVHLLHFERQAGKAYWGGAVDATGTIVGRNRLGELLMELREELNAGAGAEAAKVR